MGSSVVALIFVGFMIPLGVVTIYGILPTGSDTFYYPAPPSSFEILGNGTALDVLVSNTTGSAGFPGGSFLVHDDKIFTLKMDYSGMITIDESTAISIAAEFLSNFEYLDTQVMNLSAFYSSHTWPIWVVNSPLEGGTLCVWINAISGTVVFYALDVDLRLPDQNDLRDYFSTPGNSTLEEAENYVISFLSEFNYTLRNNSYYRQPWYKPLPPGDIAEGFVNGEFYFQIYGAFEGTYQRDNKVQLQVEASTGQVVYFSYLWKEYGELPDVDLINSEEAVSSALEFFNTEGPSARYAHMVLYRYWNSTSNYEYILLWEVGIANSEVIGIYVNPVDGERLMITAIVYFSWANPLPSTPTTAADTMTALWTIVILPLMSFSLGAAGYIIAKNRIAKRSIEQ